MSLPLFVFTMDEYLFLKVRILCEKNNIQLFRIEKETRDYPWLLWDMDLPDGERRLPERSHQKLLLLSREEVEGALRLPMANRVLLSALLEEEKSEHLTLDPSRRTAYIYGEEVRLTELEGALLFYLLERRGECATNEELVSYLWGGQASAGAVNVYIHYLREKLELRGEKVILSRRGKGYYIEPKFIGGDALC